MLISLAINEQRKEHTCHKYSYIEMFGYIAGCMRVFTRGISASRQFDCSTENLATFNGDFLVGLAMLDQVFNRHQTDGRLLSKCYQLYYLSRKH